jgi:hypothetical protein
MTERNQGIQLQRFMWVMVAAVILAPRCSFGTTILPGAQYSEGAGRLVHDGSAPGTLHDDVIDARGNQAVSQGSTFGGIRPEATGEAQYNYVCCVGEPHNTPGYGEILYDASVLGPSGSGVWLFITLTGSTSRSGTGSAIARVYSGVDGSNFSVTDACFPVMPSCPQSDFNVTNHVFVLAGSILNFDVQADAQAGGGAGTPGTGDAQAVADPLIRIDPSSPDASKFSLAYSPGIFPTPEPSLLVLFASGLSLVGWRCRTYVRSMK